MGVSFTPCMYFRFDIRIVDLEKVIEQIFLFDIYQDDPNPYSEADRQHSKSATLLCWDKRIQCGAVGETVLCCHLGRLLIKNKDPLDQ